MCNIIPSPNLEVALDPSTHITEDLARKLVRFPRQPKPRKRNRKIHALLTIINARIRLLKGQRRECIGDAFRDGGSEGIQNAGRGICSGDVG